MAYVEYTKAPERLQLTALPDGRVRIDLRENVTEKSVETGADPEVIWSAEEYSLVRYPRAGLAQDVMEHFDAYLVEAKADQSERALAAECAAYERELTKNLAGTLLELDFRLMLLEEMGGAV